LSIKNQKYEKKIIEFQQILAKDDDKLKHAQEMQQQDNLIKQLTSQLKKLKEEVHTTKLDIQKKESSNQDLEF